MSGADLVHVSGFPSAWRARAACARILARMRRLGHIPRRCRVVLSVSGVGKGGMARLNARFRGRRKPTDVLSFEQGGGAAGPALPRGTRFLGDVVVCLPVAREQGRIFGHGARRELEVLLVHGILHLLGHDHERSPREESRMRALERAALGAEARAGLIGRGRVER